MKQYILIVTLFMLSCINTMGEKKLKVLVFSKTNGYRHESISSGIKMIEDQSGKHSWKVTCTEDNTFFTREKLAPFDVVVFLNPTGDVLDSAQQIEFKKFMEKGKGFVGIHAATDCEYNFPWYGRLAGAYFKTHPPAQKATVIIENTDHPAMKPFRGIKEYATFDEWYSFRDNPRGKVHVLASLDESSIRKQENATWEMGDHPLIWWQEEGKMRSFYTVFGHTNEAFHDPKIVEHITEAINWAGKR